MSQLERAYGEFYLLLTMLPQRPRDNRLCVLVSRSRFANTGGLVKGWADFSTNSYFACRAYTCGLRRELELTARRPKLC